MSREYSPKALDFASDFAAWYMTGLRNPKEISTELKARVGNVESQNNGSGFALAQECLSCASEIGIMPRPGESKLSHEIRRRELCWAASEIYQERAFDRGEFSDPQAQDWAVSNFVGGKVGAAFGLLRMKELSQAEVLEAADNAVARAVAKYPDMELKAWNGACGGTGASVRESTIVKPVIAWEYFKRRENGSIACKCALRAAARAAQTPQDLILFAVLMESYLYAKNAASAQPISLQRLPAQAGMMGVDAMQGLLGRFRLHTGQTGIEGGSAFLAACREGFMAIRAGKAAEWIKERSPSGVDTNSWAGSSINSRDDLGKISGLVDSLLRRAVKEEKLDLLTPLG